MNKLTTIENAVVKLIENNSSIQVIDEEALKLITKHHKKVSDIKTPKHFIKQKMGMDYVEYSYMRDIAQKEYPGYSWNVIKEEMVGSESFKVHGRLMWFKYGHPVSGDAIASHRIQKKRGSTTEFVDIGNDVKAANTDCIKKAFNMHMNICDDVYRNQVEDPELDDKQLEIITDLSKIANREKEIMEKVENGDINAFNYKAAVAKLERLAK